jgi:hypothetical protein
MPERTAQAPSLADVLTRFHSGEVTTVEEACGQVWEALSARLPTPEARDTDASDYEAGYLDGVNDCREVHWLILRQFCGEK